MEKDLIQLTLMKEIYQNSLRIANNVAYPKGAYVRTQINIGGRLQAAQLYVQKIVMYGAEVSAECGYVDGGYEIYKFPELQYPEYEKHNHCFGFYNDEWVAFKIVGKLRGYQKE